MAITLTAHTGAASPDNTTLTTSAIDTTGCDLIVLVLASYSANARPTVTDSKSNSWTALTDRAGSIVRNTILYCLNPIVGASHTWSINSAGTYSTLLVLALTGANTTSSFDVENGVSSSGLTIATGSVSPSEDNEIVITGLGINEVATITIDTGFTVTDHVQQVTGQNIGLHAAYLIQTSAMAVNPTWTSDFDREMSATIATFKAAATGGGRVFCGSGTLTGLGAGGPFFHDPLA